MTSGPLALTVQTTRLNPQDIDSLVGLLPAGQALFSWVRNGDGLVGWGEAATIRTSGPTRFEDANKWWTEIATAATVSDEVADFGTGLVAFASFAFADEPGHSVLTIPRMVVGRRGKQAWMTTVGEAGALPDPAPVAAPADVTFVDGHVGSATWMRIVGDAITRINDGELDKVVLARELLATASEPIDVRYPLGQLATNYPTCWTFHVDGLFGATPEMLVRRERGLVTSRVLAGTIRRTGDDGHDLALAGALARSSKDLEEHEYAVRSVADALEPHCSSMHVPESPSVLHLPNVMHLSTDVTGVAHDTTTALQLAAALHPSAAVGGTPTRDAVALIAEIEGMDRGRYAGPVGWIDTHGDGEFGIALRSALLDGNTAHLYAGCGVVSGSAPEEELAESNAKLIPVRDALCSTVSGAPTPPTMRSARPLGNSAERSA